VGDEPAASALGWERAESATGGEIVGIVADAEQAASELLACVKQVVQGLAHVQGGDHGIRGAVLECCEHRTPQQLFEKRCGDAFGSRNDIVDVGL